MLFAAALSVRQNERKSSLFGDYFVDIIIVEKPVETVNNPDSVGFFRVDGVLFFGGEVNFSAPVDEIPTNCGEAAKTLAIVEENSYNIQGMVFLYGNGEE